MKTITIQNIMAFPSTFSVPVTASDARKKERKPRMGKATRWLKTLLGIGKESKIASITANASAGDGDEKKRWSFSRSRRHNSGNGSSFSVMNDERGRRRDYYVENDEHSRRSIAVAVATAAAADAALVAAEAAAVAVELTSYGRRVRLIGGFGSREWLASIKIQKNFRGFLARKALRALKSLVKVQALFRGNLVRKKISISIAGSKSNSSGRFLNHRRKIVSMHRRSIGSFEEAKSEKYFRHRRRLSTTSLDVPTGSNSDDTSGNSRSRRMSSSLEHSSDVSKPASPSSISRRRVLSSIRVRTTQQQELCADVVCTGNTITPRLVGSPKSYMSCTESSMAKVRSQSIPKLRRDVVLETNSGTCLSSERSSCFEVRDGCRSVFASV